MTGSVPDRSRCRLVGVVDGEGPLRIAVATVRFAGLAEQGLHIWRGAGVPTSVRGLTHQLPGAGTGKDDLLVHWKESSLS